ncbi:MAG: ATP-dependent DNA helicase [Trueperaceae bacterium]
MPGSPDGTVLPPASFPFPEFRAGQGEALQQARQAFAAGKRFVVVEAPTGAGKSAIAVALAREAKSAYVLTNQKILQDQYVTDFPDLAVMKGRANYDCLVAPTHAAAAPCIAGKRFPACEECPYFTAKDVAMAAGITTLNYAYFLAELNYAGGFKERELLVLDEAHNVEGALMGFVQVAVSDTQLLRAGIQLPLPPNLGAEYMFEFAETLLPELRRRALEVDQELAKGSMQSNAAVEQLRVKQWLDGQAERISIMLDSHFGGDVDWVVERYRAQNGENLVFKPVEVGPLAEPFLFTYGQRVLMLSATILDARTFLRSLGIDPDEAEVVAVPSTFPPENRPIELRPAARLTRHYIDRDLPKLVQAITELAQLHDNEKGVIHAHSYKIANFIHANLPDEVRWRVLTHDSSDGRDVALTQHLTSNEPTILLTPSMTEGIDLADDRARWQVLCKVPYPYLGDKQVAARMERDRDWYDWRTTLAVVQAYGRSVRSPDDHAVTYLLDADFANFIRRQQRRLPPWFLEALRQPDDW